MEVVRNASHYGTLTSIKPGAMDAKLPNSALAKYFAVSAAANSPDSSVRPVFSLHLIKTSRAYVSNKTYQQP